MQWSKLRSTILEFICPELQGRIDIHVTSYRHSHDEAEKAWITVDGERILTASWYQAQWHGWPRDTKGRLIREAPFPDRVDPPTDQIHRPQELGRALRLYLDLPIQEALGSPDPFIRALSVVDRRVGKRVLKSLQVGEEEHPLVKAFYALRMNAIDSAAASRTA